MKVAIFINITKNISIFSKNIYIYCSQHYVLHYHCQKCFFSSIVSMF